MHLYEWTVVPKQGRGYRGHAKGLYLYSLGLKQSWRDQHGQKWPLVVGEGW